MCDVDAPYAERIRSLLKDPRIRLGLVRVAIQITGSPEKADDLVQDALMQTLDSDGFPWKKWTFMTHMTFVMRHVWDQQRRAFSVKREIADEDVTRGKKGLSREPPADDELDRRRWLATLRQLGARVLLKADGKHPRVRQCFDLAVRGIEQPMDQASALACPISEVYEGHRVLKRYAQQVREEWEREEDQRMRDLREKVDRKRRRAES
jgi:DNA-directed RNA polymerase specialized sigma24 family protein